MTTKAPSDSDRSCPATAYVTVTSPASPTSWNTKIRQCQQERKSRDEIFLSMDVASVGLNHVFPLCQLFGGRWRITALFLNWQPCIFKITQWFVKENHNPQESVWWFSSSRNTRISKTRVARFPSDSGAWLRGLIIIVCQAPGKSGRLWAARPG